MIEREFKLIRNIMFRHQSNILSLVLITATTCVGVVPTTEVCNSAQEVKRCCGNCGANQSEVSSTCCSKSAEPQACTCLVDQERPATPQERRNPDERENTRRAKCVVTPTPVGDFHSPPQSAEEDKRLLSQSQPRGQAVLCRWLI